MNRHLENLTASDQSETEDDSWLQQMEQYRKNQINLNTADEKELEELKILSDLQITNLFSYRKLLGKFISIYELQAIPTWDIPTIRKIIPFVTISDRGDLFETFKKRFNNGNSSLLLRYSQVLQKSVGYTPKATGSYYLGSPQKLLFRYKYQYKNLLQYGILGDKDAGEQFFKGKEKYGFDFYSFHLFIRKLGIIQSLAIGDFTVNMGQGLIQWQSIAFRKGIGISAIKRQSTILRPYNSAGEYNFHRGAGITIHKGNIEATAFTSFRKISANFNADTLNPEDYFSSFLTSGYNRTQNELDDRNNLHQFAFGGNISWSVKQLHIGINSVNYSFSSPLQKRSEPYNLYAIAGKKWSNTSIDYSYTYSNFHFFGEAAVDKNFDKAFVNGLLISVDPKVDLSLVHRSISSKYQSINGNAFTENTFPANENGFYAGITIRPVQSLRIDAYADFYKFPWLKYLVDAPSSGKDFFAQLTYTPNKRIEVYTRFHNETKQINQPDNATVPNQVVFAPKLNWRTQFSCQVTPDILLRNRIELLWFNKNNLSKENGFLGFFDIVYNPSLKPYSGSLRLQYFETGGYNSRLYAYENDLPYSYSIPAFFGKGYRYYLNLNYDVSKHISCWAKWSQSVLPEQESIGSGLDLIKGNTKSEVKLQIILYL
ncbi:MAG: helix-hairpin-helix domain-containing protein [Chitinophagaceae bacterium]